MDPTYLQVHCDAEPMTRNEFRVKLYRSDDEETRPDTSREPDEKFHIVVGHHDGDLVAMVDHTYDEYNTTTFDLLLPEEREYVLRVVRDITHVNAVRDAESYPEEFFDG
jgi:hypothetical protein